MGHVFLSYSRKDTEFMERVRDDLLSEGVDTWTDEDLKPGTSEWEDAIEREIEQAVGLVVILSPDAKASRWVGREIGYAEDFGKRIFPILVRGDKNSAVPLSLIRTQRVDARRDYQRAMRNLIDAVTEHLGIESISKRRDREAEENRLRQLEDLRTREEEASNTLREIQEEIQHVEDAGQEEAKGTMLRPGSTFTLPLLKWCVVPQGETEIEGALYYVAPFRIGQYPVTCAQFQAFVDASDGFANDEWWEGLAKREDQPGQQWWPVDDHPCENVSWYDAVAFCRWLGAKFGYVVRLPTEWEWQWAAQGSDGRNFPWGNEFETTRANTVERGIKRTTPVYDHQSGISPFGAIDMVGNVWEWCLNESDRPGQTEFGGEARRVIRGGSWKDQALPIQHRGRTSPDDRRNDLGFRLVMDPASPSRHSTSEINIEEQAPHWLDYSFYVASGKGIGEFAATEDGKVTAAVECYPPHPNWVKIESAKWIWIRKKPTDVEAEQGQTVWYRKDFNLTRSAFRTTKSAILAIAADDDAYVTINGTELGLVTIDDGVRKFQVKPLLQHGVNTLQIRLSNRPHGDGSTGASNPSGLIYRLDFKGKVEE